jgi:hypothetical protein
MNWPMLRDLISRVSAVGKGQFHQEDLRGEGIEQRDRETTGRVPEPGDD